MKSSFLASVGLHALVIAIAFISFDSIPKPIENNLTEALPITLVNFSDTMSIKEGDKTKSLTNKPAPKPTQKPQTKPEAKNIGDGEVDTKTPLKPKEKPRETNAPPPVLGKLNAKPDEVPPQEKPQDSKPEQTAQESQVETTQTATKPEVVKPAEVKPEADKPAEVKPEVAKPAEVKPEVDKPAEVKPEVAKPAEVKPEVAKPAEVTPEADKPAEVKPEAPKPAEVTPEAAKPAEVTPEAPKPAEVTPAVTKPDLPTTSAPIPSTRPQPAVKPSELPAKQIQKPSTSPSLGEEIADLIKDNPQSATIDRTRTQGGGAKRSEGNASFGASQNIDNQKAISQTLANIIQNCMKGKWTEPPGFEDRGRNLIIHTKFQLNRMGEIVGEPEFSVNGGNQYEQQQLKDKALIAVKMCAPFKDFPIEYYDTIWRFVDINFNPKAKI